MEKIAGRLPERSAAVKSREHLPRNKALAWRVTGIRQLKVNEMNK